MSDEGKQVFVCAIENAMISLGVFYQDKLIFNASIAADFAKSADEYAITLSGLFALRGVSAAKIKNAIIASVVRPLNEPIIQAIEQLMLVNPLIVGPGVKTGLDIKTDIPSQVGADIVANAVGAQMKGKNPMVVLDFGTATTLAGINEAGALCGVLICPGIRSSLDALSSRAAELPSIALDKPKRLFGKNTNDSMVNGIILGHAAMVDGLLDRIDETWNNKTSTVIATGGYAQKILPFCHTRHTILYDSNLSLFGLKRILDLNDR